LAGDVIYARDGFGEAFDIANPRNKIQANGGALGKARVFFTQGASVAAIRVVEINRVAMGEAV